MSANGDTAIQIVVVGDEAGIVCRWGARRFALLRLKVVNLFGLGVWGTKRRMKRPSPLKGAPVFATMG